MITTRDGLAVAGPDVRDEDFEYIDVGNGMKAGGVFHTCIVKGGVPQGWERDHNLMTTVGLNYLLNVGYRGASASSAWYIWLFSNNATPAAGDTAADIGGKYTEWTAYDSVTRPVWTPNGDSTTGLLTNTSSRASFVANLTPPATATIYGAGIGTASAKSSTSGTLSAVTKFSTAKTLENDEELLVTYTFTVTAS
jgi:hypothetical protein